MKIFRKVHINLKNSKGSNNNNNINNNNNRCHCSNHFNNNYFHEFR